MPLSQRERNFQMIEYNGHQVAPSFRVARGETLSQLDMEHGLVYVMHPFDVAQHLAESGEIQQAFWALEGFLERYADILEARANDNLRYPNNPAKIGS